MTTKEQAERILGKLSGIPDVRVRPMMGEYVLYYRDKVVGGFYDGELLLKPVQGACELLGNPERRAPYENAKEMMIARDLEDPSLLHEAFEAIWEKTPYPKKRAK